MWRNISKKENIKSTNCAELNNIIVFLYDNFSQTKIKIRSRVVSARDKELLEALQEPVDDHIDNPPTRLWKFKR